MEPLGPSGTARPTLPDLGEWDGRAAGRAEAALRERDLVRASAAVLRKRLLDPKAPLAEADSLLEKLRRDPGDSASWQKLAAALARAGG